ncbi:MAG: RHS repeat-associated core domain-containing protein [Gammaproteobacteria bacterium]
MTQTKRPPIFLGQFTTTFQGFVADHERSVIVVTDDSGSIVQSLAYDVWGRRRNPNGTEDPTGAITAPTTRGYTDHQHLPGGVNGIHLINMNARIYDPEVGRFMSADPTIPDMFSSQSINRMTYVRNNPGTRVDPTGFEDSEGSMSDDDYRQGGSGSRPVPTGGRIIGQTNVTYNVGNESTQGVSVWYGNPAGSNNNLTWGGGSINGAFEGIPGSDEGINLGSSIANENLQSSIKLVSTIVNDAIELANGEMSDNMSVMEEASRTQLKLEIVERILSGISSITAGYSAVSMLAMCGTGAGCVLAVTGMALMALNDLSGAATGSSLLERTLPGSVGTAADVGFGFIGTSGVIRAPFEIFSSLSTIDDVLEGFINLLGGTSDVMGSAIDINDLNREIQGGAF